LAQARSKERRARTAWVGGGRIGRGITGVGGPAACRLGGSELSHRSKKVPRALLQGEANGYFFWLADLWFHVAWRGGSRHVWVGLQRLVGCGMILWLDWCVSVGWVWDDSAGFWPIVKVAWKRTRFPCFQRVGKLP